MRLKVITFKIAPYLSIMALSLLFLYLSFSIKNNVISNIFINLSSSSLFILIAYLSYDIIISKTKRELNKELLLYAKQHVDPSIFIIFYTLSKILNPRDKANNIKSMAKLIHLKKRDIKKRLNDIKFLGFRIFRKWDEVTSEISHLLHDNFLLSVFKEEHLLIIIKTVNRMRLLENILTNPDNFNELGRDCNYKVVYRNDLHDGSKEGYLLLKKTPEKNEGILEDWGNFDKRLIEKLTKCYSIKSEKINLICDTIYELLNFIKQWINTTGGEKNFFIFMGSTYLIEKDERNIYDISIT